MIRVKKSSERGHTKIDWLDSYHSFSFGDYYEPSNMNFGPLRVFNDDTVQPMGGFPNHPHRDMEIVSIVTQGAMAHRDSTGSDGVIRVNDVQRMTAGKGILHSEFNASDKETLKFYQIWFIPNQKGLNPSYEQIAFDPSERKNSLQLIVSGDVNDGVIFINQDAKIFLSELEINNSLEYNIGDHKGIYIHVIDGSIKIGDTIISAGDAAEIQQESSVNISAQKDTKFILFDVTLNF